MARGRADLVRQLLGPALVRVSGPDGQPVGAGTLVDGSRIITCAHVVNSSLGRHRHEQSQPTDTVTVDFPCLDDRVSVAAEVVRWLPIDDDDRGDVAVLRLLGEAPAGSRPVAFLDGAELCDHPFRVLGFPPGFPEGTLAAGKLRGRVSNGLVQMEGVRVTGARVRSGFSGAPVWDDEVHGVVGVVAMESELESDKVAFLIPTDALPALESDDAGPATGRSAGDIEPVRFGTLVPPVRAEARVRLPGPRTGGGKPVVRSGGRVFSARSAGDAVVVRLSAAEPGAHRGSVQVGDADNGCTISVEADVAPEPSDLLPEWPRLPTEPEVHEALRQWARTKLMVPSSLFDTDLRISAGDVAALQVTRVTEARTVEQTEAPDLPSGGTHAGPVSQVVTGIAPWEDGDWEAVLDGSARTVMCPDCDDQNLIWCATCKGRGRTSCATTDMCSACLLKSAAYREAHPCQVCGGSRKVPCSRCGGSGERKCPECRAGKVVCPRCGGDGRFSQYKRVVVSRRVTCDWAYAGSEYSGSNADAAENLQPLVMRGRSGLDEVPEPARAKLDEWLKSTLSAWTAEEVLRKVELWVAPIVCVEYLDGDSWQEAFLLGPTRTVRAPAAVRPLRRLQARLGGRGRRRDQESGRR